jgi:N6-L-threonylcarbamoyladenine synthase
LEGNDPEAKYGFPFMCLIASGGHTDLILMKGHGDYTLVGRTRDDAAGEAFDKAARVLGLGFPGGPAIQKSAESSVGKEPKFTRPRIKDSLDFSFSGLKTAVLRRSEEKGWYPPQEGRTPNPTKVADVSSAFQEAMVDTIAIRTIEAIERYRVNALVMGGGVASNTLLRKEMSRRSPVPVVVPRPALCTDNGAMIGAAGWFHLRNGATHQWEMDVEPRLRLG